MKMGEVVEQDSQISQQHLQVASSVVVDDDDDEDDAASGREVKEYVKRLKLLFTPPQEQSANNSRRKEEGSSSEAKSKGGGSSLDKGRGPAPFRQLLPKHVERRRRLLNKRHLQILKRASLEGNLRSQFKAKREYELRFLEGLYVRNVLFQSLPHLPAAVVPKVESPDSSSPPPVNTPSSGVKSKSGTSSDNNSGSKKLDPNAKDERTLCNDDGHSCPVPKPSAISEFRPYCGDWFSCLKAKAMNEREPNHLLQVTYDNFVAKDAKALWLSKQPKKRRSRGGPAKGPIVIVTQLVDSSSKGSEPTSRPVNSNSVKSSAPANLVIVTRKDPVTTANPTSISGEKKAEVSSSVPPVLMPLRSLVEDKKGSKEESNAVSHNPATSKTPAVGERKTASVAHATPKSEPGKGRKPPNPFAACVANFIKAEKARQCQAEHALHTNSNELSVKSVISENTDSSSSTSTSVSSSSLNDNVSIGRSPVNSPAALARAVTNNSSNNNSSSYPNAAPPSGNHGNVRANKKVIPAPKPPKKYSEKMKAEASVVQRISELQKEGMWWERRLPKVYEQPRAKAHWDYLLEEMTWMCSDFVNEKKWKRAAAKKCARMIEKHFHDKEQKRLRADKDAEIRKRKTAGTIAKLVRQFWSNVQTVVEYKEQSIIESLRKKALDQKLSYLVNETEKFSEIVAQTFTAINKKTGIETVPAIKEDTDFDDVSSISMPLGENAIKIKDEPSDPTSALKKEPPQPPNPEVVYLDDQDKDFLPSGSESDVDDTIAEEEAKERRERPDHRNELDDLEEENNMSYEEILAKYAKFLNNPDSYKVPEPEPKAKPQKGRIMTRRRTLSGRQLRATRRRGPAKVESDVETDVGDSSCTEEESQDEDAASDAERTNDDLASLLKTISPASVQKKSSEEETNKLADLAESFKPKGYTLSSTNVVTKVPHLLRHTLREYQHIGLEWLVTMYDKRLNGILADEMGLGKTIQTIALLAYLAVERCNWGPHLIIVPTSVMLNWEMEFKKWCPGLKILTYYGSQKERKLKRSGWTKPNAFHICITSYKLVIQDHQSFRRKRWKYLVLDEAQNIKNFKSQRWQLLLNFNTQRRLLLTGTPLQNNLMELWSLLHFLMPNVFQSHMEFKDWFSNPMSGMVEGSQEYNEDIVQRLHKVLRPFILRRMKSEVEKQLPQKYEHVITCSLSKRQRFLYEEFMSRAKTKETLNQGNLLSVINVLMQLRKVCNHPNLFEPRPIVSPFHTDGIHYSIPSCSWDILRSIQEDSFRQSFPLFTISNPRCSYSEYLSRRIEELTPLFAYNPDEERRYVVMNYAQCADTAQPPAKRIRRIVNLVKSEPPPCPRMQIPTTFFISTGKPDRVLKDPDFVDCLKNDARNKQSSLKINKDEGSHKKTISPKNNVKADANAGSSKADANTGTSKADVAEVSESEKDDSSDSEVEVIIIKKRKVAKPKLDIRTRLNRMGCTVPDFSLDAIQERTLHDRKLVVNNLNKVNWTRCSVHTFVNPDLVDKCKIVGTLPLLRLTSRKTKIKYRGSILSGEVPRDYTNHGYFNFGFNEIMKLVKIREECPGLINHPTMLWSMTKHLDSLVLTPESRVSQLMDLLRRYVMYIPAVSAPSVETRLYRPSSSVQYFNYLRHLDHYKNQFFKSTEIVHPVVSRMLTQFPDPRLIQYDCGKLQTLDKLLRRLKTGNHRVLIFTQMAKVLDILEAFLNYHGHNYLRLDGSTKIDQRQLLMERFNADKKIFCFILSTRSGGIGVNLTGADTVIFYDSDWNPTMDAQAQDRCHRIGQTRDVHIYRLVSEKTVEVNILSKSNQKKMLGELAIEGGKFTTTYFKQHTIRDLFTINEKEDPAKRLNSLDSDQKSPESRIEEENDAVFNPVELQRSPEKKRNEMHTIECALAAVEDETDIQAARTVHAEAEAEMAEFDENLSLDALDAGKYGPNKFELQYKQVVSQLTDVERYAMRLMESTIDDWSKETVAQAQKDLEEQKLAWELQQQKAATEFPKMEIDDDNTSDDLLTYSRVEPMNSQMWVAQYGNIEQDMLFPMYEPPTPPHDEMDVYLDPTIGYLYNYDIMTEDELPPVYIPKNPKKLPPPPVSPVVSKPDIVSKTPEPVKDVVPDVVELDSDSSPTKKSPKIGRREDPIFAPKSLFDRPSPAMAKIRRDLRLQRYNCRPAATPPKTLGPGSITFPIIPPGTQKTPPPPTPADSPDWLIVEDNALVQTVRTLELPNSLMVVNLAQTPNWDFAQEMVSKNIYPRNWRNCKYRYEQVVGPREEGKVILEPTPDPASPSSGKKKKTKTFIKIAPPSPSKAGKNMKISQLMSQDNNAQLRQAFANKFEMIKNIANKRAPTTKPVTHSTPMKFNKHSLIMTDLGINYDNPLPATAIAQSRFDRQQMERKKADIARLQQQQAAAAAAASASAPSQASMAGVQQTVVGGQAAAATAMNVANPNPNGNQANKPRGTFTQVAMSGTIAGPMVIQSNMQELREVNIPNIIAQQNRRQAELAQQQQQVLLQRQALTAQAQSLTSLLNQPQVSSQQLTPHQAQQSNLTVVTSGPVATTQTQQIVRPPPPVQVHQGMLTSQQPIVLTPGAGLGLAHNLAPTGSPISVSNPVISTLPTPVNTTATLPSVARTLQPVVTTQPQLQRVPTLTMQDLVSSATSAQRFQNTTIITSSAPSVQTGPPQSQQSQPTLVSLTPMMGSNNQQLTTKLIQNPQGFTTLVQSPSPRPGTPTIGQQAGSKLTQLQYFKQGLLRPSTPVSATVQQQQQQQQVQQIKDQLMSATGQIKRIQVVTASPPPTIVSSSGGVGAQPPPPVSLPPVSTLPTVSTFSSIPVVSATSSPVVTISSAGTTSKVSLSQPHVTIMQCQSSPNVIPPSHVMQHQQQAQRQLQLVKQHTVGGKTVTRPVSDAEVAAFLKQHGILNYPAHTAIPVTKTAPAASYQGPVPVQGSPTLLTVGLQNIMKVHQTPGGSVATLVKSPGGQAQASPGGALSFPVHVSKVNTKGTSQVTGAGIQKQQGPQTLGVQQVMIQRRQPQDPTQHVVPQPNQQQGQTLQTMTTATSGTMTPSGKIAHITTQVPPPGTMPTHVVVQTTQKQLPNTIAVQQLQQVFKQVGATGQIISQTGQVLQPQLIGKPIAVSGTPNSITVTTSGATSSAGLGKPPSATSTAASLVHVPSNLVQAGGSSIHARIVPVSVNLASQQPGVKQTIQVVSAPPPNSTLLGPGPLTVRQPQNPNVTSAPPVNHTIQLKLPPNLAPPEENN